MIQNSNEVWVCLCGCTNGWEAIHRCKNCGTKALDIKPPYFDLSSLHESQEYNRYMKKIRDKRRAELPQGPPPVPLTFQCQCRICRPDLWMGREWNNPFARPRPPVGLPPARPVQRSSFVSVEIRPVYLLGGVLSGGVIGGGGGGGGIVGNSEAVYVDESDTVQFIDGTEVRRD